MSSGDGDVELYNSENKILDVSVAVGVLNVGEIITPAHRILAHQQKRHQGQREAKDEGRRV